MYYDREDYEDQLISAFNKIIDVMEYGEKTHKKDQWRYIGVDPKFHIDHAIKHGELFNHSISSDMQLEHISHMATRSLMALQLFLYKSKK